MASLQHVVFEGVSAHKLLVALVAVTVQVGLVHAPVPAGGLLAEVLLQVVLVRPDLINEIVDELINSQYINR